MGESTNESIPPEAWSHGAFLASWGVVAFDEPRSLEGDLNAISRHLRELFELAAESHEPEEPIVEREAVALAQRIKNLTPHFDGRADYIADLAGRCLTLKEGQAAGEVFRVSVVWKAGEAARLWEMATAALKAAYWWRTVTLAIPAEFRFSGPDSAFGVQSASWLHRQCEAVARECARRDFPPGSLASRRYDGGDFAIPILDVPVAPVRAGPAVSVVPAPDEATIAEYIERAASCPDHWDALACVADVLTKCRQPLGDALGAWNVEVLRTCRRRPDARKAAKTPANALRNHAIIMAVRALGLRGWPATTFDREPGPACEVCARVFGLEPATVRNIWKKR